MLVCCVTSELVAAAELLQLSRDGHNCESEWAGAVLDAAGTVIFMPQWSQVNAALALNQIRCPLVGILSAANNRSSGILFPGLFY